MSTRPLVLLAHGSRRPGPSCLLSRTAERVGTILPGVEVRTGYVELQPPDPATALEGLVESEGRETLFVSRGGYVPGRRVLGKRRVALRREFFPGKPWLGLGTIDWCAGVRSTPVYAGELDALVAAAVRLASTWDAALRSV